MQFLVRVASANQHYVRIVAFLRISQPEEVPLVVSVRLQRTCVEPNCSGIASHFSFDRHRLVGRCVKIVPFLT